MFPAAMYFLSLSPRRLSRCGPCHLFCMSPGRRASCIACAMRAMLSPPSSFGSSRRVARCASAHLHTCALGRLDATGKMRAWRTWDGGGWQQHQQPVRPKSCDCRCSFSLYVKRLWISPASWDQDPSSRGRAAVRAPPHRPFHRLCCHARAMQPTTPTPPPHTMSFRSRGSVPASVALVTVRSVCLASRLQNLTHGVLRQARSSPGSFPSCRVSRRCRT